MNRIKVLSEEVANRIAAGEVIERPVSVVKELVENSIDAGATDISVTLQNGGKKLIQVSDNGFGMSETDALQCFERHATSKIRTVTDIFNITSLGFRGEALPSIASVGLLTLITKDEESDVATKVEFNSGRLTDVSKTAGNTGTTVTLQKLFNYIPARKKFLRSDKAELKHIMNYIHYQAVLFPNIRFKLVSDDKEKINFPAVETTKQRMTAIFGSSFGKKDLIEINTELSDMKLTGYISGLEDEPSDLLEFRYLFVNGRYIKDRIINHSIKTAYEPFIQKLRIYRQGRNPSFILFLELEPKKVDFNVHPAKTEIRFGDASTVHGFVKSTVSKALLNYEDNKFKKMKSKLATEITSKKPTEIEKRIFTNKTDQKRFSEYKKELTNVYQPDIFKAEITEEEVNLEKAFVKPEMVLRTEEDFINPWQLHQSYIFVQVEEGLMVIDQHAAHERIIYETILHRIHGAPANTQKLLFPIVIDLPKNVSHIIPELISENMEVFEKIGFSIKTFSGDSIIIDEIPAELEDWDGGEIFIEILKQLDEEFKETEDFRDSIAKSVSCKAAIKAGKKMGKKEMLALINDLFGCEVPYYCPHGRPLIIKMPITDFEKKFKRI
jgi:DNA mismatch repair protein MutL